MLTLDFASRGPWCEERINPRLFETVLGYTRARGPARVLLATLAALANDEHEVLDLTTEDICAAAGLSDRSYRRARASLLESADVVVESCAGGRGKTSRWRLTDPRPLAPPLPDRQRVAPARNARPLLSTATPAVRDVENPGQDRTVCERNPGQDRTVSEPNPGQNRTLSAVDPGQDRTVSSETPAKTPAETPAPYARAGTEPENQKNQYPPSPPAGGSSASSMTVIEEHITDRGRKRRRAVTSTWSRSGRISPTLRQSDEADWVAIRAELAERLSASQFEIWLAALALIAVDQAGVLLLSSPAAMRSWVKSRFGTLLDQTAGCVGRQLRLASEAEVRATSLSPAAHPREDHQSTSVPSPPCPLVYDQQEAS